MDFLFTVAVIAAAVVFVHHLSERLCRWMEEVNERLEARWRDSPPYTPPYTSPRTPHYDKVENEVENGEE